MLSEAEAGTIVVAKRGAGAVVIGLGENETFVASDIPAVLPHTRRVVLLEDDEIAVLGRETLSISSLDGRPVQRSASVVTWDAAMAEKGGYAHFMLKEIHEQPQAVADTMRGRVVLESGAVDLPEANLSPELVARLQRVYLVSCGTSYHAALIGRSMVERLSGLRAEADLASEFRYRDAVVGPDTLIVAISQSGETADTLGAVKAARDRGASVLGITNVVGSALAREADGVIYTHAGPEIGVASTKTFTATVTAAYLFALALGLQRGFLTSRDGQKRLTELAELPALMAQALEGQAEVASLATGLAGHSELPLPGPRPPPPRRARRGPQAQGDLLHPRRGLCRGRNEARPHRSHRRAACPWSPSPRGTDATTAWWAMWKKSRLEAAGSSPSATAGTTR